MNKIFQFLIFFTIFVSIYFLMHYYVFNRIGGLLGVKKGVYFYLIMIIATLSFIGASILERTVANGITRIFYIISATWFGIVFLLFSSLLVFEIVNLIFKVPKFISGIIIISLVVVLTIFSIISALFVSVKTVDVPMNIDKELRIVQLSDLHVGTVRNSGFLIEVVKKTNKLEPDAVMITGDLIDSGARINSNMFDAINDINSEVFFVIGNHETYEDLNNFLEILGNTKTKIIRNDVVEFQGIQIIGMDHSERKSYFTEKINEIKINKSRPSILLYHPPVNVKELNKQGISLQLAGHTHAGQIFPFNFLTRLVHSHIKGLHEYNGSYIYVSPGTGTWGPPMRLGSNNEITVIKLKSK